MCYLLYGTVRTYTYYVAEAFVLVFISYDFLISGTEEDEQAGDEEEKSRQKPSKQASTTYVRLDDGEKEKNLQS